jgi:transposase
LQWRRSELCERTFAHVCNRGGMRRSWVKGVAKLAKRYLIAVAAHNLGRIMFKLFGIGKPKTLQDENGLAALVQLAIYAWQALQAALTAHWPTPVPTTVSLRPSTKLVA